MHVKHVLIVVNAMIAAVLACNLGVPAPTTSSPAPTIDILTLAAQTLAAQSPTAAPGITVEQALTLAVETLQAQATPTPKPVVAQPSPKPSKTRKPTSQPPTATQVSTGPTSTRSPFHLNLTFVAPIGPIQLVPQKLDYNANANYGAANLSAGFSPDPYSVGMTTGGSVNVSYLGSSCSGFATAAPDLRINFSGGGAPLLRIYFIGTNADSAFVVNDPYGNFYCVDDSFGTVNPTIDFNNPAGGTYNVWVASYAASTTVSGTLYITENSGNHP